jgi:malonyl-CoA O-methyltransferase
MRDLKALGARNATAGRPRSLLGRSRLQRVLAAYESFRKDGRLPATYEIVYGAAWGTEGRPATAAHLGEVTISPAEIKRRK